MNSEELQHLVFETLGGCSWEFDLANDRLVYSAEFFALLGYGPDELAIDPQWVSANIHPEDLQQWRNAYIESVKGQRRFFDCELRFRHKRDHFIWIQTRGIVSERDSSGRARRIIGIVFDISERKASKDSETRYRLFLDNIPDALSLKDRQGRYIYINRQFEDWLGKPSYQIYGQTAEEIFHPRADTLHMLEKHENQVWEQGKTVSEERQFPLTSDGKFRHAAITKFPIFDETGKIIAIGTTNTDVTERFNVQEKLRQSERRYRQLFDSAPAVLVETDWSRGKALIDRLRAEGVEDIRQYLFEHPELMLRRDQVIEVVDVNHEALRVFQVDSVQEFRDLIHAEISDDQRRATIEELVAFAAGEHRTLVQTFSRRSNGEEFPLVRECELYGADPEDWSRMLITVRDTSTEQAVRESERRYRSLFELAPAVLAESDWSKGKALIDRLRQQGIKDLRQYLIDHPELLTDRSEIMTVMSLNREALRIYKSPDVESLIRHTEGKMNEAQRRGMIEDLVNFSNGQRRSIIQSRTFRLTGEEFPISAESELYGDDPEDWSKVLLTIRDTSAEEAVRLSEERYRRLFDSAPAILGEADWSAAKRLVDDLRARGIEDIPRYLFDHPELTGRRQDFMQMLSVNHEAQRVFRVDGSEAMINFLNRPLEEEVRLGIIGDVASFLAGEKRSTLRTWEPSATGDRIPIVRDTEIYSDDPEDWSKVLISIRDIGKEEAVRMSEIRFRRLFESAPAALYESDWSRGKQLVERLLEQGVVDIRQYLTDRPELIERGADVLSILNANQDAISMFRSRDKQAHIDFVEGKLIDEQRMALIEVLDTFGAGRRRSLHRTVTVRENDEQFPIIRNCELISSDRDDWSLVLISIQDMSVEVEAARKLEQYQEELRSLAGKISLAEESERRRISSELHDGTIQNLVLARIHLATLKNSIETEAGQGLADSVNDLLETSLKETRSLIFEISPPVLYELGLESAVEWLTEHYKQRTGVGVTISSDDGDSRLSEEMNIVVFQAARELLVNIAKHARAQNVSISWQHSGDRVTLTIEDDGIGFDVEAPRVRKATEGGFGLFAVRERLKLLGADFDIESSAAGSRMQITAPVYGE